MQPLPHNTGNAATGGVWRVPRAGGSAILKVARPPSPDRAGSPAWQTSDVPTHWNYWRREANAYASGFAASAYRAGGIVAPELLELEQRPDGSVALWLADAPGAAGFEWPVRRLFSFAHQLGVAQAGWAGRVPDDPWLSRRWLRQYLVDRHVPPAVPWDHPAAAGWPSRLRLGARALWEGRERLLLATESAPRTLCHLDVWPNNLIAAGPRTVLLDWAFVGEGALGEDIANLIVDSVADGILDPALLPEIADGCTEGYLTGLADGGWTGSPDVVRGAIASSGAAKYSWLVPRMLEGAARAGPATDPNYGRHTSMADLFAKREPIVARLLAWAGPIAD